MMKKYVAIWQWALVALVILQGQRVPADQLAFPDAEGFGARAEGGRGGEGGGRGDRAGDGQRPGGQGGGRGQGQGGPKPPTPAAGGRGGGR